MKANPKMKAEPKAEAPAPGSKKKLMLLLGAAVLVIAAGSGAAAFFLMHDSSPGKAGLETAPAVPPDYVTLEPFTVNLQPENGDQYLQVQFTLQVANLDQAEVIKSNMALVRNRVLLLLSGKKASEINTVAGKKQLAKEILAAIKQPFVAKGATQEVTDVLFTSFIIQ